MNEDWAERLGQVRLFAVLSRVEQRQIAERCAPYLRTYDTGAWIGARGELLEALPILLKGNAVAEIHAEGGKTLTIESFRALEVIASSILFAPEPYLPVTIRALAPCAVVHLPRAVLLELCRVYPGVLEALLLDMGQRTAFLADRLRMSRFATLRQQIAAYLLERRARHGGNHVHLGRSRQALADVFGVARPSLSRELSRMCEDGLIAIQGAGVELLQLQTLAELMHGCE